MAMVDRIQVLIEADASGLQSQLKKGADTVTRFISQLNDGQVNWEKILAGSISPAIITGVASMYAMAISQSLQFQQTMNTQGTAAGDTAEQTAQVGTAAQTVASQTGQSATDIAGAMLSLSAVFSNVNDQQQIASDMSMLAASGFGNLSDIVKTMIPLFQQWGITSGAQAQSFLTSIMHAAEGAKENIPTIGAQFEEMTPPLVEAGTKFTAVNGILAAFSSEVAAVGSAGAQSIFDDLAASASNSATAALHFGTNAAGIKKSLIDDGGLSAIKEMASTLGSKFGDNTSLIASALGITAQEASAFVVTGQKFPQIATNAADIANNVQSIQDAFNQSDNVLRHVSEDWNKVKAAMTSPDIVNTMQNLLTTLESVGSLLQSIGVFKFGGDLINTVDLLINGFTLMANLLKEGVMAGIAGVAAGVKDIASGDWSHFVDDMKKSFDSMGGAAATASITQGVNAVTSSPMLSGLTDLLSKVGGNNTPSSPTSSAGASSRTNMNNVTFNNTFNVSGAGGSSQSAQPIAASLYDQFQGVK